MKTKLIKIGNARGVCLPQGMLREVGVGEEVILEAKRGGIVIRPSRKVRSGWEAAFKEMSERGDDTLLDSEAERSLTSSRS